MQRFTIDNLIGQENEKKSEIVEDLKAHKFDFGAILGLTSQ